MAADEKVKPLDPAWQLKLDRVGLRVDPEVRNPKKIVANNLNRQIPGLSLFVSNGRLNYADFRAEPVSPADIGQVQVEVRAGVDAGFYLRRLTLCAGDYYELRASSFDFVELTVLDRVGLDDFFVGMAPLPSEPRTDTRSIARLAGNWPTGRYVTPPGARQVYPSVTFADFAWITGVEAGVDVTIPTILSNASFFGNPVKGCQFEITAAETTLDAVWEIAL